ncbi:MAG: hypothetical protein FJZ63_00440, partial [Chlamydiae bacterium]|nr:hypothetical protein [Chlamydiota bacterium]
MSAPIDHTNSSAPFLFTPERRQEGHLLNLLDIYLKENPNETDRYSIAQEILTAFRSQSDTLTIHGHVTALPNVFNFLPHIRELVIACPFLRTLNLYSDSNTQLENIDLRECLLLTELTVNGESIPIDDMTLQNAIPTLRFTGLPTSQEDNGYILADPTYA